MPSKVIKVMIAKKTTHFEISERKILLRVVDIIVVISSVFFSTHFLDLTYFKICPNTPTWFLVLNFYVLLFGTIFEIYDLQKAESRFKIFKNLILTSLLTVLFFLFTPKYTPQLPENRMQIVLFFLSILSGLLIWRWAYISLIASPRFYKRILLVGDGFDVNLIMFEFQKSDPNYEVVAYINTHNNDAVATDCVRYRIEDVLLAVRKHAISEIVVTNSFEGVSLVLYQQLIPLLTEGFPIRSFHQVYEELTNKIPVENIKNDFYCYFPFSRSNQNKLYLSFVRLFDIIIAITGLSFLIIISPFILFLNLLGNRGPLFYSQKRVGKDGEVFNILKLRSMVNNAESDGAQWAIKNDIRVTKFGKLYRKTRLDELPQFYNVLKGEMSFIGPRPERPEFVRELAEKIPFYEIRHVVKPGLTGWAQVKAKYASTEEDSLEKLQFDLYYIKKRNVFLDIRIFLKTMSTVIFFRGQ